MSSKAYEPITNGYQRMPNKTTTDHLKEHEYHIIERLAILGLPFQIQKCFSSRKCITSIRAQALCGVMAPHYNKVPQLQSTKPEPLN